MFKSLTHAETGDEINISVINDGPRNTVYLVSGDIKDEQDSTFSILNVAELAGNPTSLRLDSLVFFVESGLKVIFRYKDRPYVFPLEGRGKAELEALGGVVGKEIDMTLKGVGTFLIVIDISKLGV